MKDSIEQVKVRLLEAEMHLLKTSLDAECIEAKQKLNELADEAAELRVKVIRFDRDFAKNDK